MAMYKKDIDVGESSHFTWCRFLLRDYQKKDSEYMTLASLSIVTVQGCPGSDCLRNNIKFSKS
jgi:hypothetical protein